MREVGFNEQQPVYGSNQNSRYSNGYDSSNAGYGFHPPLIQASNDSQGMDGYQTGHKQYNQHYGPPTQYGGYPNNHYGYHGNKQSYGNYSQNSGGEDNSSIPSYVNYHGQQLPVVMLSSPSQSQGEPSYENQGYGAEKSNPQTVTYTQQWTFPPGAEIPDNLPGYPSDAPSTAATGSGTGRSAYPTTTNSGYGTGQSAYPATGTNIGTGKPAATNGGTAASSIMALYGMLSSFSHYLSQAMTALSSMMSGSQGLQIGSGQLTGGTTGTGTGTMGQGGYTSLGGGQQSQTANIQQLQTLLAQAIEEYQSTGDSTALQSLIAEANSQASDQSSTGSNSQQQQVQQLLALIQQAQSAASSGNPSLTYPPQTSLSTSGITGGVDLSSFSNSGASVLTASPTPSTTSSTSQPNSFSRMLSNNIYQYYNDDDF